MHSYGQANKFKRLSLKTKIYIKGSISASKSWSVLLVAL